MENAQKALIMAGSAFMFVIAVSIAIYSYSTVIATVESILTSSEQYNQTVEGFVQNEAESVERYATEAEVMMTIMSMQDDDYVASAVKVDGVTYKRSDTNFQGGLNNSLDTVLDNIQPGTYSISYELDTDANTSVIVFTKQ